MGVLGLPSCFGIVPHPHSYEILRISTPAPSPTRGGPGWGAVLRLFIRRVGKVKRFPPQDCAKMGILGFQADLESFPIRIRTKY